MILFSWDNGHSKCSIDARRGARVGPGTGRRAWLLLRLEACILQLERSDNLPRDVVFQMDVCLTFYRGTLVTLGSMLPPVNFLELIIAIAID